MEDIKVVDVLADISKVTTIPLRTLTRLMTKVDWCICEAVQESTLEQEDVTAVDIGIGIIYILIENDSIQYKFVPSLKLEKYVRDTVVSGKNPMVVNLEETFVNRLTKTYKDMF